MTDETPQWERQPGEPNEWYRRFRRYLMLSGRRSLLAVYNIERSKSEKNRKSATSCPPGWRNAFKQWRWKERAAAWDDYNNKLELEEWQQRRRELREREWQISQAWIDKAEQMLKMPIATITTEDGKTIVSPAKWTFRDAIYILVESCALARRACQMQDDPDEIKALQVLVDGGYLPMEVLTVGADALRQATQVILEAIARGNDASTKNN